LVSRIDPGTFVRCIGEKLAATGRTLNSVATKVKVTDSGSREVERKEIITSLDTTIVRCIGENSRTPELEQRTTEKQHYRLMVMGMRYEENGAQTMLITRVYVMEVNTIA
jgi:hypothetical protein